MRQIIRGRGLGGPGAQATPSWANPLGPEGSWEFNSEPSVKGPWGAAGTFSALYVAISSAAGANTVTFEIYKNSAATGLLVTFTGSTLSNSDLVHSFAVAEGDLLSLRCTANNFTSVGRTTWSLQFDGTTTGEHGYSFGFGSNHTSATLVNNAIVNPFFPVSGWAAAGVAGVVASAMTVSAFRIALSATLFGTNAWRFTLVKNAVAQDGTGGTPDTRIVMNSGTGTTGAVTGFSLSLAAGDRLHILAVLTAGSVSPGVNCAVGLKATATVDGESTVNVRQGSFGNNTRYAAGYGSQESVLGGESTHQWADLAGGWTWRNLYGYPDGAVGGSGVTLTVRQNTADSVIDGAYGTGSTAVLIDTADVAIAQGDLMTIRSVGTSGVASRTFVLAYIQYLAPPVSGLDVNVSDAVTISEGFAYWRWPPEVDDTATVTEFVKVVFTPSLFSVSDAVTVTDAVDAKVGHLAVETVTVTDVVTLRPTVLIQRLSETVSTIDVLIVAAPNLHVHLWETVAVTESPMNQNTSGIGTTPPPPPGSTLQDYWVVGIV